MAGLYIHIPFCASRCLYCAFYSTVHSSLQSAYIDALCKEIELQKDYLLPRSSTAFEHPEPLSLNTVYIGGGTPSQLTEEDFEKIFSTIHYIYKGEPQEITIECNPDDLTPAYASMLKRYANRISLGIQTFDDDRLRFINRRHSASQALKAVELLQSTGFENISIDLMFGFPNETLEQWNSDLTTALRLGVKHISGYSLMFEEGTKLYNLLEKGKIHALPEELSLAMYDALIDRLTAFGFEHYEISNFAMPGFRSLHNSNYWKEVPYLGVGASAHSFNKLSRQWNVADIRQYISSIERGEIPMEREVLDEVTRYNDLITTALRTSDGVSIDELSLPYRQYIIRTSAPFIANGTMERTPQNTLRLTRKGLYISDNIMAELIKV